MPTFKPSRRAVLGATVAAVPALLLGQRSMAQTAPADGDAFGYEVTRTESEWRSLLTDEEYKIMREGGTEVPKSDPQWDSTEAGIYACKGCDLDNYDARWKVVLDKGWLFFRHSQPNAVLTGIDMSVYDRFERPDAPTEGVVVPEDVPVEMLTPEVQAIIDDFIAIEVHCRRCGSHFGHILWIDKKLLHCVNGAALSFVQVS
jgi:peptide-methionine (R)-S-oxide reductase